MYMWENGELSYICRNDPVHIWLRWCMITYLAGALFILSISGSERDSPRCTTALIVKWHTHGSTWWADQLCTHVRMLKCAVPWVTSLNRSKTRPQTSTWANSTRIRTYTTNLIWLDSHFDSWSIRHYIHMIRKRSVRISKTTSQRNLNFTDSLTFLLAHYYFNQLSTSWSLPYKLQYMSRFQVVVALITTRTVSWSSVVLHVAIHPGFIVIH